MPNLIIKPTAGGNLILQDQGGDAILTSANDGATLYAGIAVGKAPTDFNSTGVSLECIDGLTISSTTTNPNIYLDNQTTNGKKWTFQAESGDGALTCKNVTDNNTAFQINTSGQFLGIKMASGNGIDFSATSDAGGMTSELFDDYEEGTWTPNVTAGGTSMSTSTGNTSPSGTYTKTGDTVFLTMDLWGLPVSTSSGALLIKNLPFTSAQDAVFSCRQEYYPKAYELQPIWYLPKNSSSIILYELGTGSAWLADATVSGLLSYYFFAKASGTYKV